MKRMLAVVLYILCCSGAWAQEAYFIFIQNVSGQPFYVRLGEDSHSSSAGGHLILSSLHDSTYKLFIGFPRDVYPEQLFTVRPGGRDRGFELRRVDGAWRLFDLQTLELLKPELTDRRDALAVKSTDSYSVLMAGVVNDSAVLYKSPNEPVAAASPKDSAVVLRDGEEPVAAKPAPGQGQTSAASSGAKLTDTVAAIPGELPAPLVATAEPRSDAGRAHSDSGVTMANTVASVRDAQPAPPVAVAEPHPDAGRVHNDPGMIKADTVTVTPGEQPVVRQNPAAAPVAKTEVSRTGPDTLKGQAKQQAAPAVAQAGQGKAVPETGAGRAEPPPVTAKAVVYDKRDIIRYRTENVAGGKLMIYLDRSGPVTDTISIIIPRL